MLCFGVVDIARGFIEQEGCHLHVDDRRDSGAARRTVMVRLVEQFIIREVGEKILFDLGSSDIRITVSPAFGVTLVQVIDTKRWQDFNAR